MLKLVGNDTQRYYAWDLEPGTYLIGRLSETSVCDLAINDRTVSRRHASLEISSDCSRCSVTDLYSHNGTMVNGRRITGQVEIKLGDHLQFGSTEFKLIDDSIPVAQSSRPTKTLLTDQDPERSVMMSMEEIRKPLPSRVVDLPELLPTLFNMARMLVLPEPKESMLERTLQLITTIIPADRLAVLFVSDDSSEVYTGALHLPGGKDPGTFTLSRTIVNDILIDDAREDPRFADRQSIIVSELKSAMAVPLLDEDRVLGILYADTTNPSRRYNDDFLRLFATVGNIIASRLANYSLLEERREKELFEAELARASLIQKTLLPLELPEISGYSIEAFQEQCRAVGGDLYDVAALPDGRILFLVADVSGKGMGAALLMSNILASFRILYAGDSFDLTRAVNQVSAQLFRHSASEHFATLLVGLLDAENDSLTFVNAGHNPPLLVRSDGSIEQIEASGIMIGAFDYSGWSESTSRLSPGDFLIVFTDGVTEAERGEDRYSDERLEELLVTIRDKTPREIAVEIMKDVERFVEDTPRSDDITMLIIKRNA